VEILTPELLKPEVPQAGPKLELPKVDPTNPNRPFDVDPAAKAAGKTVYLAALTPFAYVAGPWKYQVGVTGSDGKTPIKVQNKEYKFGLSAHPPANGRESCRVSFVPGGEFKKFRGWGAMNHHDHDPWGKIVFTVWGDGKKLWESQPLNKANTAAYFDIDITGVKVLTLETRMKDGSHHGAHAVWLDPWLER
jgi:hypothetical protein